MQSLSPDALQRLSAAYNLGGSPDWQALLSHFELGDGFAFIVLLVPNDDGSRVCRAALEQFLQGRGKSLLELPVSDANALKSIAGSLLSVSVGSDTGAVWVSRAVPEGVAGCAEWRNAWREGVARLNQFRNPLRRQFEVPLVFVGAPWLQEVLREAAPDLWSVRTLVSWVEPRGVVAPDLRELRPAAAQSTGRGPDPELALEEVARLRAKPGASELVIARLLFRAGQGFASRYQWQQAARAFEESMRIRQSHNAPIEDQADSAYHLGSVVAQLLEYECASEALELARSLYRRVGSITGKADCIYRLGAISLQRSQHGAAAGRYAEALSLYRRVSDPWGEANCIASLGDIALQRADYEGARTCYEDALPLFRRIGSIVGEADCIRSLGEIAMRRSDHETARTRYEEALLLFRQVGGVLGEANSTRGLGEIALERSDYETAETQFEQALQLYRQVGSVLGEANCIGSLGDLAAERLDHEVARAYFEHGLLLFRKVGNVQGEANCIKGLGDSAMCRADHGLARKHYEEALPLYRRVGSLLGEANCSQRIGIIQAADQNAMGAAVSYFRALQLYERIPAPDSIAMTHLLLARLAPDPEQRAHHAAAARATWQSIGRQDLIDSLDKEFGPASPTAT